MALLKKKDDEKKALERSKNELEAFIFDTQDKLTQDDYIKCSTEEQREAISKKCLEASDWLDEQGDDTPTKVLGSSFYSSYICACNYFLHNASLYLKYQLVLSKTLCTTNINV